MNFKNLETNRLLLRSISKNDSSDIFNYLSKDEVTKYLGKTSIKCENEAKILIDKILKASSESNGMRWGIVLKENNKLIGLAGYNSIDFKNKKCNLGYDIDSAYWHNGYGMEAVSEIIRYAFYDLNLHRIEAEVVIGNNSSSNLLTKLGFKKEGMLRQSIFKEGDFLDVEIFSLIQE
ncbi:GNAT family N-acetyltransferase [Romboutsia sp. MSSM.1001216sp_RTP31141st1_G3_RTP31141_220114]|uniref:GNAT family N-acetyltransferase n=1 Tax=unclassified Romboutsia TaxID=2626894 RepID=UPI0031B5FE9A